MIPPLPPLPLFVRATVVRDLPPPMGQSDSKDSGRDGGEAETIRTLYLLVLLVLCFGVGGGDVL